jgi:hypothetical protein
MRTEILERARENKDENYINGEEALLIINVMRNAEGLEVTLLLNPAFSAGAGFRR